jgi:hypothetical protein
MKFNIASLKKILSKKGFYIFLLPAFFILHGYVQNFGLITFTDCLTLFITYVVAVILIYFLAWILYRNPLKASLLCAYLFSFFLFFGALDDFLRTNLFILSRYSVIIPLYFTSLLLLTIYLKKTKTTLYKFTFFINLLFLIFLAMDIGLLSWKMLGHNSDRFYVASTDESNYQACTNCKNPDIYFLLFDGYSSTLALKQTFHYDNSELDSFLIEKGFSLQRHSQSNYNFTPFSMASILNMNYLHGIEDPKACTAKDYARCNDLIRNNETIRFLSSRHYSVINYSIFDLANNPSLAEPYQLPLKTRLITDETLYNRLIRDIVWNLFAGKFEMKWLIKKQLFANLYSNNKFITLTKKETTLKSNSPRFIYAHLEMPHRPYYYGRDFILRDFKSLIEERNIDPPISYQGYLHYTNSIIKELVETIQKNTNNSAVIILMGDHGFRIELADGSNGHFFKNLNAVYFPEKDYQLMTDGISGVNQFRVILNTLFKQHLPLLKDSTILLVDHP